MFNVVAGLMVGAVLAATGDQERTALTTLAGLIADDEAHVQTALARASKQPLMLFEPAVQRLLGEGVPLTARVRAIAVLALLDWPQDATLLDARVNRLGRLLFDSQPTVRQAAAAALGYYSVPLARKLVSVRREGADAKEQVALDAALAAMHSAASIARLARWLGPVAPTQGGLDDQRAWSLAEA
ncbi:MAG: hypothetical protein AAB426_03960, partial [Myxococcota bacterium]